MDTMLFSDRSVWTMIHGIVLGVRRADGVGRRALLPACHACYGFAECRCAGTVRYLAWLVVSAPMLATAVAFVAARYRSKLLTDMRLNSMATTLLAISFVLASIVGVLGIFINKVAPLE